MTGSLKVHMANADVLEVRASRQGAQPMPLAPGEVAEFSRPLRWWLWTAAELGSLALAALFLFAWIGS